MNGNELNWKDFTGSKFLKAEDVNGQDEAFAIINVSVYEENGNKRLRLSLQRNQKDWLFDLNKTNSTFIQNAGINSPSEMVGCKVYFRRVLVTNPQTKNEVESLRVCNIDK